MQIIPQWRSLWQVTSIVPFDPPQFFRSEKVSSIGDVPKVSSVTPWDGKDAVADFEEYPLEDLLD